jgi:hypothetical protein
MEANMDPTAEKKIVEKYFLKSRQDRALYALRSAKRHAYIWNLNESFFRDANREGVFSNGDKSDICLELAKKGCDGLCYVLSIEEDIDGTYMPAEAAIRSSVGNGPALLVFNDGELAYFEGEYEIGSRTKRFLIRSSYSK